MKKYINSSLLFLSSMIFAQAGINTKNPIATFHVDGGSDNPASGMPSVNAQSNDFVATSAGMVGIGTVSPLTRLDVRAANLGNSAIGIGYTSQAASAAQAGALRYNNTNKCLEFSDGIIWNCLASSISKAVVLANNNTVNTQPFASNTASPVSVLNWSEIQDNYDAFEPATGTFTAPRDGVYMISFTSTLSYSGTAAGSKIENVWLSSTGKTLKYVKSFPAFINAFGGAYCSGSIYLNAGETLNPYIWHNTGNTRFLRIFTASDTGGAGFNNLSIVEQ
ncbi:hypothetical protein ACQWU4_03630 [Chryseobacterium sp. MIQD13]|uniref:hypothetical protein n=1 Tax=Chryseobacterium sp. MIQD13 TaxID=3422310 RepID=UPI003D2D6876